MNAADRLTKNVSPDEAEKLLSILRWREDQQITNAFGERVWLKPCHNADGVRIGITDCCDVTEPCEHHAAVARAHPDRVRYL